MNGLKNVSIKIKTLVPVLTLMLAFSLVCLVNLDGMKKMNVSLKDTIFSISVYCFSTGSKYVSG